MRLTAILFLLLLMCSSLSYGQKSQASDRLGRKAATIDQQWKPAPRQKNYPILRDARELIKDKDNRPATEKAKHPTFSQQAPSLSSAKSPALAAAPNQAITANQAVTECAIENPLNDPSFQVLTANDDTSSVAISLPFNFNYFGTNYTSLYINNNGSVSFNSPNNDYATTGIPAGSDMIAPFWADVDTRHPNSGLVYYKSEPTRFTVIWYQVGYYREKSDKVNTFKLVITNGADPLIGTGNNVAFFYEDMQWATGDAYGGVNGFGGTPATVGMDNTGAVGECFFFQLGRFGKPGTEFINPIETSGVDYLDYQCFYFDASVIEEVKVDFDYEALLCAIDFEPKITNPQNCEIYFYEWNFGDGNYSEEWKPLHSYSSPGTYTVSLDIYYGCGACEIEYLSEQKQITLDDSNVFKDTLINITTDIKEKVLSSSSSTYADVWPLEHAEESLNEVPGFLNGTEGVWRNEGAYVYEVPRKRSSSVALATDGSFSMSQFNWEYADLNLVPDWIKTTTMTEYSSYSYELENQNVLGVHSAVLYDYGGHLPSANGYHMKQKEMAFTSFEYLDGKASGNWVFGNQRLPRYYRYPTLYSRGHIAVVKASLSELEQVNEVDVYGRSVFFWRHRYIRDNEIVCRQVHPENPNWSVLVLRRPLFDTYWKGGIKVKNAIEPLISPDIDASIAHSGKHSLKISAAKTFKQKLLRLDSTKAYLLSAWVSVNNPSVLTPKLADNLGITIALKDQKDQLLATTQLVPSGPVIEGWQQVKGIFVCPEADAQLELTFRPGSTGTAWYDDLRLHPEEGNMKSYVYALEDYRLQAILDEENFASFFYYDEEGNLYLTKKETVDGIKTLTENISHQVEY